MTVQAINPLEAFQWTPQPKAEEIIRELMDRFLRSSPFAAMLQERFYSDAGVRFTDLVDCCWLQGLGDSDSAAWRSRLMDAGWVDRGDGLFVQDRGIFPKVVVLGTEAGEYEHDIPPSLHVAIRVESIADFVSVWQVEVSGRESHLTDSLRLVSAQGGAEGAPLKLIERHGYQGLVFDAHKAPSAEHVLRHREAFTTRPRRKSDDDGFQEAGSRIDRAIADLGVDYACDLFFAAERDYWQRRNWAAQVQKARQDRLGLGWANHDHHTYRSSRRHFTWLISIFEKLGFHCRERFYAGKQAGWGAQILEQPNAGIVIFADVDLSPDELLFDFAHEPLRERDTLGTVGLWCALHGESFLQAGMHHLECQFDFDALRNQLQSSAGVRMMKPFTDFPYLRQAFTEGERWRVAPARIDRLLREVLITEPQAEKFRSEGAIGSHLENLERNQGFKGFNQTGVSEIIAATDPRKHLTG